MTQPTDDSVALADGKRDLSRCSWCGRKGTLTDLSMGNRCVIEQDCYEARQETIERADAIK